MTPCRTAAVLHFDVHGDLGSTLKNYRHCLPSTFTSINKVEGTEKAVLLLRELPGKTHQKAAGVTLPQLPLEGHWMVFCNNNHPVIAAGPTASCEENLQRYKQSSLAAK